MACGLAYARARVRARRSDIARVPELVATTLDRLATQAALHARGGAVEPYIPIGQLRDDVLRSELHGKRREELWQRVRRVVEGVDTRGEPAADGQAETENARVEVDCLQKVLRSRTACERASRLRLAP